MQNGSFNPQQMGPFGPMGGVSNPVASANTNLNKNEPTNPVKKEAVLTERQQKEKELSKMTVDNLRKISKKLSISGFQTMKKTELIEAILRVSK